MSTDGSGKLPEFKIEIGVTEVRAERRKLKAEWTMEAAQDLKDLFDERDIVRTPLERLVEHIDDPNYDPNDPEAERKAEERHRERQREARLGKLVNRMADQMRDEVDREILDALENL